MNRLLFYFATALIFWQLQFFIQTKKEIKVNEKMKITYVMDPQCGWCYGNSENITALHEKFKNDFDFELVVGGMWLGTNAPVGGEKLSQFLQKHAPRMAAATGALVDKCYYELAKDSTYTFSSLEPSAAIQLIKELDPDNAFLFAKKVQLALFVEGKKLDDRESYIKILKSMSSNIVDFDNLWMKAENISKTKKEFTKARSLASGFPTLVLSKNGRNETLASGYFTRETVFQKLNQLKQTYSEE